MKLKRTIAKILAFTTLITSIQFTPASTITVRAGGFNSNAGGNAFSQGGGNGLGGDGVRTLETQTTGVRMTLIDPITGETMSKSIDIVYSSPGRPVDVYTGSRVEHQLKTDTTDWRPYGVDFITTQLAKAGYKNSVVDGKVREVRMPFWYYRLPGNKHIGNSDDFKFWFCPDTALDALSGVLDAINDYADGMNNLDESIGDYNAGKTDDFLKLVTESDEVTDKGEDMEKKIGAILKEGTAEEAYRAVIAYCNALRTKKFTYTNATIGVQYFKQKATEYIDNYDKKWPGQAETYDGWPDIDELIREVTTLRESIPDSDKVSSNETGDNADNKSVEDLDKELDDSSSNKPTNKGPSKESVEDLDEDLDEDLEDDLDGELENDLASNITNKNSLLSKLDSLFTMTVYAAPEERDTDFDRLKDDVDAEKPSLGTSESNGGDTDIETDAETVEGEEEEEETTKKPKSSGIAADLYLDKEKGIINTDKYGYACALLLLSEKKRPDDNAPISIFSKDSDMLSGTEMVELFANGDAYFCVEPIMFFQPQTKTNYWNFFYGTVRDYGYYAASVLASWDPVAINGGNIFRGPNVAFPGAFTLVEDEGDKYETDAYGNIKTDSSGEPIIIDGLATKKGRTPFLESEPYNFGDYPPMTYGRYSTDGARYTADTIVEWAEQNIGLGMHLYCVANPGSKSRINTYDIINRPKWDDNSESAKDKPDESDDYIEENKNKTFQIAKFYRIKIGNEYLEQSYYSQKNTPHTVQITDEIDIGWKLTDWFTSPSEWLPPDGNDPSEYPWESYVRGNNPLGTYEGTGERLLRVQPDDPDNTLYLLYELDLRGPNAGKVHVIRVYDDEDGSTDKVEKELTELNPYPVPEDKEYLYVETKMTTNPPNDTQTWNDSEGTSQGTPIEVRYPEGTKTIYIHYIKKPVSPETKKIILWENELSYNYDLRDLLVDRKLIGIYDSVASPPPYKYYKRHKCYCGGCRHSKKKGTYCPGHPCYSTAAHLVDREWTVAIQDNLDENTLPFIKDWKYISEMQITGTTGDNGGGGNQYQVKPNASYLLIRNREDDVVTLYPGKNESLLSELSQLNLSENYTSSDTRYSKKRETNKTKKYYRTLTTGLAYSAARDTQLSWWTDRYGYSHHEQTGTFNTETWVGPGTANAAYSKENNVETRYFLGEAGKGEELPIDVRSNWNKRFSRNTSYANTSADLSFYPYLKYLYYNKDNTVPNDVMVTSSNLSGMKVFNAIQAGVYKKNEINANLSSTQWSTHARSLAFLQSNGISDKKSVLPGGAIQDIDTGNKGDTQIGITIWQSCLPDNQVQAVQEGFKVSETEAKTATNNLIEEIKKSITGYGLVQWGQEGTETDFRGILDSGEELHENSNISFVVGRNSTSSADNKYYLRHDGTGSNRANFDCLDSRIENQFIYTIYSDTEGNVWVTKDGTELGRISKTEDKDKLLQNAELKLLDDNTKLITNYISCIQRNKGNARNGSQWHNEAFDGVSVIMTDISFDIGYGGDSAIRTNVLDPLLVAQASSKSDLYNFDDESKIRSSVYVTTKTSSQAEKPDQEGYLGTLKAVSGMGDLETGLTDIVSLLYTKTFFVTNATVSDLN